MTTTAQYSTAATSRHRKCVHGNTGTQGGAINNQAGGTLTVADTTFSANSATTSGGGLENFGTATVTRTTFSGNSGGEAAGAYNGGTMTIVNSTFVGNQASVGAGALENNSTLHLTNSTFFDNSGAIAVRFTTSTGRQRSRAPCLREGRRTRATAR
jgi:predicted outer membrane repeat protein